MEDYQIEQLATRFRTAIEKANSAREYWAYNKFRDFPTGCCGYTSDLLAEYLLRHGIETLWVSTAFCEQTLAWFDKKYHDSFLPQSHAFLVVKDERVKKPTPRIKPAYHEEHLALITPYHSSSLDPLDSYDTPEYKYEDLFDGLIIDITADQFKEKAKNEFKDYFKPVYLGCFNDFYKSLDFRGASEYKPLDVDELEDYRIIEKYIE